MNKIDGVVIGTVKNLKDPQNLGRIEVHFPWLSDDNKSHWARVATLMAGSGRGSWFMPEKDDEVLVAFEHGDTSFPYIVGFLWNGQDKPPNQGIDSKVRRLKTVSGHVLEFDDRPGQTRITIETQGGQKIELKDLPAGISISTTSGNEITISDLPPQISISCPTGVVTVNCLQASVNAAALLNVNAPVAQFSGVVQAAAIVSPVYTPGVGNFFGL
jgi:uncharacterized protein involved in type VI secretion and phage assembly